MCPASAKVQAARRREHRHRQALYQQLQRLPPPFGAAAEREYRPLALWWDSSERAHVPPASSPDGSSAQLTAPSVVDWARVPAACDPVALLDNAHNTTRRKGVPVDQQVASLSFSPAPQPEAAAPASGNGRGAQPQPASRGQQKRWQVESFAAVLRVLLAQQGADDDDGGSGRPAAAQPPLHVVDFGCGTGGLLLPLAWMFPSCTFVGVEMKRPALHIVEARAQLAGLTNVRCHLGMIEDYDYILESQGPLDVALALHACGNATDHVMLLAQRRRAALLVSPCCVGKLKFSLQGGSSFSPHVRTWHALLTPPPAPEASPQGDGAPPAQHQHHHQQQQQLAASSDGLPAASSAAGAEASTGGGEPPGVLCHPRSAALRAALAPDPEKQFKLMASVADTNFLHSPQQGAPAPACEDDEAEEEDDAAAGGEGDTPQRAGPVAAECASDEQVGWSCKLHVELDRLQAAREAGYAAVLHRTLHAGSMAKGDLLVAVPAGPADRARWRAVAEHMTRTPSS